MERPTEMTETSDRALGELRRLALERSFDRLESLWMEAAENAQLVSSRLDGFLEAAEVVSRFDKEPGRLGALLELLLPSVGESVAPQAGVRFYSLLVRACPSKKDYRAAFADRFERLYPLASAERVFYEACGFSSGTSPAAALTRLEKLLKFREGAYVYHRSGWGVGKVIAVDPFLKQVKVDLEGKRDHRIAIGAIDSILEPLSADSFLVHKFEGGGDLRRLRDEDPVRLVGMLCDTFGSPIALKDLKNHLVPLVLEAAGWNRWWNRAKGLLRDAGYFRVGDRAPYHVEKLEKAVSYEDELIRGFVKSDWAQARQVARQVARRGSGELEAAWGKVRERLLTIVEGKDGSNAIEAAIILERGAGAEGREALLRVLARLPAADLLAAMLALTGAEDQRRAVEALPTARPADWQAISSQLFAAKKDTVREAVVDLLERQAPDKIRSLIGDLIKAPKSSPEAFCFALQSYLEGLRNPAKAKWSSLEAFRTKSDRDLLVLVMDLLDHLQHHAERRGRIGFKEIIGRVEDIIGDHAREFFLRGAKAMAPQERQDLYARLVKNESLSPHLKGALLQHLLELEPTINVQSEVPPWEEECLYCTAEGLEKKKAEFREIMEVKLPKVFEDIGRAAAFGDLSENAEYTSALEERDHLTKRATRMKAELDKARLIVPETARKGVVGLGSRLRLLNLRTSEEHSYSLLGPWDGGPEDGVLNYLSPLGRLFHGRKEGDEIEAQLPGGTETYRLLQVGSHFDPTA